MKKQDVAVAVVKINFSPPPPSPFLRNVLCPGPTRSPHSSSLSLSRHNACIHASLIVQVACVRDERERGSEKEIGGGENMIARISSCENKVKGSSVEIKKIRENREN